MNTRTGAILALLGGLVPASLGFASASVAGNDWDVQLMPGAFEGVFDELPDNWMPRDVMQELHAQLNAGGVDTGNCITTVLIADGDTFSLLTVMDAFTGDGDTCSAMGMRSTAPDHAGWFINDQTDQHSVNPLAEGSGDDFGNGGRLGLDADFRWIDGRGDGFMWTGLMPGDTVTYDFDYLSGAVGSEGADIFKFLGWDAEDGWEILGARSFSEDGSLSFEVTVIPAPGAGVLLILAGLVSRGRRRD